jgi:hypothetical protein
MLYQELGLKRNRSNKRKRDESESSDSDSDSSRDTDSDDETLKKLKKFLKQSEKVSIFKNMMQRLFIF